MPWPYRSSTKPKILLKFRGMADHVPGAIGALSAERELYSFGIGMLDARFIESPQRHARGIRVARKSLALRPTSVRALQRQDRIGQFAKFRGYSRPQRPLRRGACPYPPGSQAGHAAGTVCRVPGAASFRRSVPECRRSSTFAWPSQCARNRCPAAVSANIREDAIRRRRPETPPGWLQENR
jgi:hypothetical protein